ncbi:hypothetical protein J2S37_000815 [Corynebacterium felinum]|uniref:Uncharacterized protein n=1 Tax=Corynebacterium felinum TaxID=131318 RepID=A0ABU2B6N5_9CORY|nr:hypothetical protein [Corynebacterium felinum]
MVHGDDGGHAALHALAVIRADDVVTTCGVFIAGG